MCVVIKMLCIGYLILGSQFIWGQNDSVYHGKQRALHYTPEGKSFVLKNGHQKFNRALYGTNTGFRVETGDLPEFALYMPGMGGNFQLGIIKGNKSKWLTEVDSIKTLYTPGYMTYTIKDSLLNNGEINIKVVASYNSEGMLLQLKTMNLPDNLKLIWIYGGATGKKFHRDGDIGADPESVFYLQPKYCKNNTYKFDKNSFTLTYGWSTKHPQNNKVLTGSFPNSKVNIKEAKHLSSPSNLLENTVTNAPIITGILTPEIQKNTYFWKIENSTETYNQITLKDDFEKSVAHANTIASQVTVNTPNKYINTLGGALSTAADAIWEDPAYLHGAVAWRMYLNAWRGAYVADVLGWHDRAKKHFTGYANSQVLTPNEGPIIPDTTRYSSRQVEKIGTALFTEGYISRRPNNNTVAHHYDMNLVFFDQLLTHVKWTGDTIFLKEMWPTLKRHLAWEKRNFDSDNDGLYDAYATIWASDALQYSGGKVTYTSAYNYRANIMAAQFLKILNENPSYYEREALKIKTALDQQLWVPEKGIYAEYKDILGNQLSHDTPGIWTIYHTIDEGIANDFKNYQLLNYVTNSIPHIPINAEGFSTTDLFLVATSNWQPYTWSVNNVALAENLNMALAYWQGNNTETAYKLWESALTESMYMSASPGGFEQLSLYDAMRGELYRDFADPIGVAGRTLIEGLFGIKPDALKNILAITPGFPNTWPYASLATPDISIKMEKATWSDYYEITPKFDKSMKLSFAVDARYDAIKNVTINGEQVSYQVLEKIGQPKIRIESSYAPTYKITINWKGNPLEKITLTDTFSNANFKISKSEVTYLELYDPQQWLLSYSLNKHELSGKIADKTGDALFFVKVKQNQVTWWIPITFKVSEEIERNFIADNNTYFLETTNNTNQQLKAKININNISLDSKYLLLPPKETVNIPIEKGFLHTGRNQFTFQFESQKNIPIFYQDWNIPTKDDGFFDTIDLSKTYNAQVQNIFRNQYFSPRPTTPTLQLPTTGVGNWCYPTIADDIDINPTGLKKSANTNGIILSPQGIPFKIETRENTNDIVFASQWDTYPNAVEIQLSGKASHAYFILAGSTNPMQTRMTNGIIEIAYTDGTNDSLALKNPENWWPIEQDYFIDGYAFTTNAPKPKRVYFKTGNITDTFSNYRDIHGFTKYGIDGGAGILLDIPLHPNKTLDHFTIKSVVNDVVIGLMSLTLKRTK
ncbi:hypothetical protein NBRC110019_02890 [Neptunitalea chrysea]|uniref:DUF4450 domain-containing protein n=1 Tax=Neptunitalea chrysea TaxID=1647581 RepID=A0A9W6B300_9FLAO|nr:DUF4450 domain-containing protein [Neptunitalea chrysea]GLB51250.1 hypothetical protein NBRC110019_02890 [Neptunitalea chrysea]